MLAQRRSAVMRRVASIPVHHLARAVAEGATAAGAEVRFRTAAELAPEAAIASNPRWAAHAKATRDVAKATLDDLAWADGFVFGTPTRFGNVASQLRQFLDTTSGLWVQGKLANKAASGFTCSATLHGGQESTLLSMYQTFMHWGAIIVPTGYTDPSIDAAGGNPYGVSSIDTETGPDDAALAAARYQGARVTEMARPSPGATSSNRPHEPGPARTGAGTARHGPHPGTGPAGTTPGVALVACVAGRATVLRHHRTDAPDRATAIGMFNLCFLLGAAFGPAVAALTAS